MTSWVDVTHNLNRQRDRMSEHLTVQGLADRWEKSPKWVREQARQNQIPGAWKLGRQWRFNVEQIEAYEQSQRTDNIFRLTPGSRRRQQAKRKTA